MCEDEKDYSDYLHFTSSRLSLDSLLGGFTFTAFTILLTQLPDRSGIASQFTLFFLATLFWMFIVQIVMSEMRIMRYCRKIPSYSKELNIHNSLELLSMAGLGLAIPLMLVAWGLIYVALATGVVAATCYVLVFACAIIPALKWRKTIH